MRSNNDPYRVASLHLKAIEKHSLTPLRMRIDCGSENGVIAAAVHSYLRRNHGDQFSGIKSHIYGSSPLNQRIEAWWSVFRRSKSGYIIDSFKKLVQDGVYNPDDELQKACAWFYFVPLIRQELSQCKELSNSHYIRRSQHRDLPGRPDYLYFCPPQNYTEQGKRYSNADFAEMRTYVEGCFFNDEMNELYEEYFMLVSGQIGYPTPNSFEAASELFQLMIEIAL